MEINHYWLSSVWKMKSMWLLLKFKKQKLPVLVLTACYPWAKGSIMAPINVISEICEHAAFYGKKNVRMWLRLVNILDYPEWLEVSVWTLKSSGFFLSLATQKTLTTEKGWERCWLWRWKREAVSPGMQARSGCWKGRENGLSPGASIRNITLLTPWS